jgi:hypothetical protein
MLFYRNKIRRSAQPYQRKMSHHQVRRGRLLCTDHWSLTEHLLSTTHIELSTHYLASTWREPIAQKLMRQSPNIIHVTLATNARWTIMTAKERASLKNDVSSGLSSRSHNPPKTLAKPNRFSGLGMSMYLSEADVGCAWLSVFGIISAWHPAFTLPYLCYIILTGTTASLFFSIFSLPLVHFT